LGDYFQSAVIHKANAAAAKIAAARALQGQTFPSPTPSPQSPPIPPSPSSAPLQLSKGR